jgi:NAD(P)-dependent dehydrogenase (short-subunit alcohol dehydrogenase family)
MNLNLAGKHVLITGGSKGIGLACAEAFLNEGAKVSLVSRDLDNLNQAKSTLSSKIANAGSRIHVCAADLKDHASAAKAIDQVEAAFGPVDVLVNSAGAAKRTPAPELTPQAWRDTMDAKFFTYINMIDPIIKRMDKRGVGNIVNIVGAGGKVASPVHLGGGSANAALMLASTGLANAYAQRGIRVNVISPGVTETERFKEGVQAIARAESISYEEALNRTTSRIAMGRPATPEEIANTAVFLASDAASYVNGAVVNMDGASAPTVLG